MTRLVLPDTSILIDYFRNHPKAVKFVQENHSQIILSSIVVAELYAGVKGDREYKILESFISIFRVVPVNTQIAKTGGFFRRDYGKSHGVGLADAIIAASAFEENARLITLNTKHFPMVKNLQPAY